MPDLNLKALRQRAADVLSRLKELNAKAIAAATAGGPALSDDERAEIARLKEEFDTVDALRRDAEALNEQERQLAAVPDPDVQTATRAATTAGVPRVTIVEDEADKAVKAPGFWGRQLQAVYRFAASGGQMSHLSAADQQLLKPMMAVATGMNTDTGSEGGFLVAQDRATTVAQRMYSQGVIAQRVSRMPISPNSNGIVLPAVDETSRADGSRYGGIASGWLGQGNTLTPGKPKFRPMDMKLRKVGAFVYTTDELLADSIALEAWINRYLPLELTFRAEDAFLNGTGATQPIGALNSGAVVSVTRSVAAHITSEDLQGMIARMWAPLWSSAVFLCDQSILPELHKLSVPVGTGGSLDPAYRPAGSIPGQIYATYMGIPIIPVEYCAPLGTSGDIILINLGEYTVIDKGAVDQAVSMHVAFLTDEQVFRFIYRVDGQLNWNAPLTPKSGGPTLAPVVVLT